MKQTFDLIQEITRNDSSRYYELGNIAENCRAEYAVAHGYLKEVRILKMNIPRSSHVEKVEAYLNENYEQDPLDYDGFTEWPKSAAIEEEMAQILLDNKLG
ncbi:hypothetical protein PT274_05855 [Leuconostocaceae bacterium ESL0958]|nr:hypothetical protein [Leuconostocaceae bacterium ESL0958]